MEDRGCSSSLSLPCLGKEPCLLYGKYRDFFITHQIYGRFSRYHSVISCWEGLSCALTRSLVVVELDRMSWKSRAYITYTESNLIASALWTQ